MAKAEPLAGVDPDKAIHANAAVIIPARVAELLAWERYIEDPDRVTELHAMRIAAKRLRYTLELFAPFYGPEFAAAIVQIKGIQERLGEIHDADVLVPQLWAHLCAIAQESEKHDPQVGVHIAGLDAAAGLIAQCRRKREERDAQYRQFLAAWYKLRADSFFDRLWILVREKQQEPVSQREGEGETAAGADAPANAGPAQGGRNGKRKKDGKQSGGRDDTRTGADPRTRLEEGRV